MNWYDHLYMGEKAKKQRYGILKGLREKKWQPEIYVIMPPESGNNILEIIPSVMLHIPPYREREILLLGVAVTYWEALEVAREIVDDLYQKTGGFRLADLINRDREAETEMLSEPRDPKKSTMRGGLC